MLKLSSVVDIHPSEIPSAAAVGAWSGDMQNKQLWEFQLGRVVPVLRERKSVEIRPKLRCCDMQSWTNTVHYITLAKGNLRIYG